MQKCKKCGYEIDNETVFCPKCGTPVKEKSTKLKLTKQVDLNKTLKRTGQQAYGYTNLEDLPEGYLIDNRYEIKEKLGQGGFGAVYRAFDKDMNIDKALKVIPEAIINDKEAMFDLQKEAQTMISLNHTNIVRVYDFHKSGKIKYIDMEYIDGKTLTDIKLEYPSKQIPESKVKELAIKIADGLAYAHSNNIIHKDIKPQNVMVTKDNKLKIMDFGIAEKVRSSMSRLQDTTSSGTLVYMSPEQIKGKNVGKESDIYSFGAMLYELLSGHPPFYKGDINYQILNKEPEKIKNVSEEINSIILKCLNKDYKKRYTNIDDIIQELGGSSQKYKKTKKVKPYSKSSTGSLKKLVSISIITEPSYAIVFLDGKRYEQLTPLNTKHIIGEITIKIEKEGYETIEDVIDISESSANEFYLELVSIMGSINVTSDIPDQRIWLNDEKTILKTPHTFENIIPDKEYSFQIASPTFLSKREKIKISNLEDRKIKLSSILGSITVETEKPGQIIILNEEETEFKTPHTFENIIPSKEYSFQINHPNYLSKKEKIKISNLEDKKIKLSSVLGSITVETEKPGQIITLNDEETEFKTPHTFENIIPSKEYTIQINNPNFLSKKEKIKISNLEDRKIKLTSILGSITVETEKPDQLILMNGKATEFRTPHTFERITPGKYKIEFESEKYYLPETEIILKEKEHKIFKPYLKKYSFLRIISSYKEITFEVDGMKINANEKIKLKPGNKLIKPNLEFLPSMEVSLNEGELTTYNFDENIPTKKLLVNAGNYDKKVEITSFQNKKREEIKFKGDKTFSLLPGIYNIKVKHKSLTKTFKIDLQQEDQELNIFHEIEIIERKKKITFISLPIFTLILIISSIKITSSIKESKSWEFAKTTSSLSSYGYYIAEYPKSKHLDEIYEKYPVLRSFVFVKGGTFQMGSNVGRIDEKPVHTITISDYYIGKYEVTQKEWKEVMGNNPSYFKGDNLPVEKVSWYDAVEFCNKKSKKEGLTPCYSGSGKNTKCSFSANGYRLPTEAEWEYAARGGNKSKGYKYSGSNNVDDVAWYFAHSSNQTHSVGTKKPNKLGIYDMSGNIWEWCNDWYGSYRSNSQTNPRGYSSGSFRVDRGGSWRYRAECCCVAYRDYHIPGYVSDRLGFRLLRSSR